jgi:8-oxo-dGTP diphosphatase
MKEQSFTSHALIVSNKKVLLLHRSVSFRVWEFPGGGIEFGESPEEAAVREVKEETGLTVKSMRLWTINSQVTPQKHHHIWFLYRCKIMNRNPMVSDEDHDEIGWFTLEKMKKLPDLALPIKAILPQLKKVLV